MGLMSTITILVGYIVISVWLDVRINFWLTITMLVVFLAFNVSLYVRREHDLGRSGHNAQKIFLPGFNVIYLFTLLLVKGEQKDNQYGPMPQKSIRYPKDILGL